MPRTSGPVASKNFADVIFERYRAELGWSIPRLCYTTTMPLESCTEHLGFKQLFQALSLDITLTVAMMCRS